MTAGESGVDQDPFGRQMENLTGDELLRRQAEYSKGRKRFEVLRSCEKPEGITWAARQIVAGEEAKETTEYPNRFTRDSVYEGLQDRIDEILVRLDSDILDELGLRKAILGPDEDSLGPKELKDLADGLEITQKEFWARWRILEAYRQHRQAGMDLEQVTVGVFTSLHKVYPEAGHLGIIGNAKETFPKGQELGKMVNEALHAWCDIGGLDEQKEKDTGVPNIFNDERFEFAHQKALDYVTARILSKDEGIEDIPEAKRSHNLYWQDAQNAARLSLEIFRLFDLDVTYDLKPKKIPEEKWERWRDGLKSFLLHNADPEKEDGEWEFKGGMNSGDLAKAAHFILRQVNEFGRDCPRQIGAPATIGCFPNLTLDFMRMIGVKIESKERYKKGEMKIKEGGVKEEEVEGKKEEAKEGDRKVERGISLWRLWREKGISFGNLPWGKKEWKEGLETLEAAGLLSKKELENTLKIKGISQDAYDVPYTLQHFYAVGTVFTAITRKDLEKAFMEVQDPNYLYKLNKGFELTFAIMTDGSGLKKETMTKLRQLTKVNFLIGVLAANIRDPQVAKRERASKVTSSSLASSSHERMLAKNQPGFEQDPTILIDNVIDSAKSAIFLSSAPGEKARLQLEKEEGLIRKAMGKRGVFAETKKTPPSRRGFLPSESGWFSTEEIEAIKESGLYAPYNKI